jgi:hypothetical protein
METTFQDYRESRCWTASSVEDPLLYENGWLDPSGLFHAIASVGHHCEWCIRHKRDACRSAAYSGCPVEDTGWIKLAKGEWIIPSPGRITRSQVDFIFDWHLQRRLEMSDLLKWAIEALD